MFNKYWTDRPTAQPVPTTAVSNADVPQRPAAIIDTQPVSTVDVNNVQNVPTVSDVTVGNQQMDVAIPSADRQAVSDNTVNVTQTLDHSNLDVNSSQSQLKTSDNTYNIQRIIRRMKVGRAYQYKVALHDSDQEPWLRPEQIPFQLLYEYNQQAAKNRQQRLRGQRSGFGQR